MFENEPKKKVLIVHLNELLSEHAYAHYVRSLEQRLPGFTVLVFGPEVDNVKVVDV